MHVGVDHREVDHETGATLAQRATEPEQEEKGGKRRGHHKLPLDTRTVLSAKKEMVTSLLIFLTN